MRNDLADGKLGNEPPEEQGKDDPHTFSIDLLYFHCDLIEKIPLRGVFDPHRAVRAIMHLHEFLLSYVDDFQVLAEICQVPCFETVKQMTDALYALCNPYVTQSQYLDLLARVQTLMARYVQTRGAFADVQWGYHVRYRLPWVIYAYILLVAPLDPAQSTVSIASMYFQEAADHQGWKTEHFEQARVFLRHELQMWQLEEHRAWHRSQQVEKDKPEEEKEEEGK